MWVLRLCGCVWLFVCAGGMCVYVRACVPPRLFAFSVSLCEEATPLRSHDGRYVFRELLLLLLWLSCGITKGSGDSKDKAEPHARSLHQTADDKAGRHL